MLKRAGRANLLLAAVLLACRLWPHEPLSASYPSSTALYDDHGRLLRLTLARDDRYRLWLPLETFPPDLVDAVLLKEDRHFYWHPGVNPSALTRAAWRTYVSDEMRQGGSTVTMQLARLMDRGNTHSIGGKLRQIGRALQLELFHSKHDILEAYLNLAPYGRNVEGAGAASQIYFGKPVQQLALPEILALAVLPQNPTGRGSGNDAGFATAGLEKARGLLFSQWQEKHPDAAKLAPAMSAPLKLARIEDLPFNAPHFTEQVLRLEQQAGHRPGAVTTTLDLQLQRSVERHLRQYIEHNRAIGIRNATALLVDTRDMSVKAAVGSADWFDAEIEGQVNGLLAKRSPGSTLKPFIYALGADQGLLHSATVLKDAPTSFGPFSPENFDGKFVGPITAKDALIRSRNVPAVAVAAKLANPNLYGFLQAAGISRLASEQHYGLALTLGGGEVTPEELAGLYAMLANSGTLKPLRHLASEPQADGKRLISEEASFMVMRMLRENPRPDELSMAHGTQQPTYWKTGTSWGFHDAWTAGIFGPYVLVVWVGNFNGDGNPAFVGLQAAAPLFFRIVDGLRAQQPNMAEPAQPVPAGIAKVEICLATGELPNAWCPQRGATWFIPGKSPIKVSDIHRPVAIQVSTGKPVCPPWSRFGPGELRIEVYEYWPSDLARLFRQAGLPRRTPPALPAECAFEGAGHDGTDPQITSPIIGAAYTLRPGHEADNRVPLHAIADADAREMYWFANNGFIGRSAPGASLDWQPPGAGQYALRVVDDRGRSASRQVTVAAVP
jgi:penicillin-binding protein 1C